MTAALWGCLDTIASYCNMRPSQWANGTDVSAMMCARARSCTFAAGTAVCWTLRCCETRRRGVGWCSGVTGRDLIGIAVPSWFWFSWKNRKSSTSQLRKSGEAGTKFPTVREGGSTREGSQATQLPQEVGALLSRAIFFLSILSCHFEVSIF